MSEKPTEKRNDVVFDKWSIVHLISGIAMSWLMTPFIALLLLVSWEPVEILLISPLLARFDIVFGFETLKNSLSDIVFDVLGVLLGTFVLRILVHPPFQLF